ncbi:hypothetical protein V8C44DRAFT_342116 [Trichoderma aethiopicum]
MASCSRARLPGYARILRLSSIQLQDIGSGEVVHKCIDDAALVYVHAKGSWRLGNAGDGYGLFQVFDVRIVISPEISAELCIFSQWRKVTGALGQSARL